MVAPLLLLAWFAADDPPAYDQQRREAVARLAPAKAKQLQLFAGEEQAKAALVPQPLLRWSNPTAGSVFGEVYLWTVQERPVAIASIYRWYHPLKDSTVEVVSMTPAPVEAREGDRTVWQAPVGGLSFQPLANAPEPAATAAARLGQMRNLAREFSAQLIDQRGGQKVTRELRLLNQPVHRYADAESGLLDGALFAFVETTDPEAWLLIEAVKSDGGTKWRCGLARMNADELKVSRGMKLVAEWPKIVQPWRYRTAHYTLFGFDPEQVPLDEPKP